ncbi:MAG TPA: TonB-dependent siderophore receptor, partial [Janthinobacterium sp.]|nr:TonB-dependent siderophore receptor [Janthinobacterium sp.]
MSTPHFKISALTLAVLQACAAPAFADTANDGNDGNAAAGQQKLPEVVVTGTRADAASRASVAGFSETPLLETPASVSVVTSQQLQELNVHTTTDAMRYDASVSDSYNAVGYSEQFSIRGFALDNNYSYRKDGLEIPGDTQIPLENKERIEVLKGLSGFQAGVAAPGGIVDYITKRPTDKPLRQLTVEESERGTLYGAVDLGGRFEDTRFGYRINAAVERLRSYIIGADGNRKFVSGAFDWQISPDALLQLDMDYQKKSQISAPGFQLINNTTLPVVSAKTNLNDQPWSQPVQTTSSNIGLRFEYKLNQDWHATIAANRHEFRRDDYTAFPEGCSAANLDPGFCSDGGYDVWDYKSLGESKSPIAAQALLQGKFNTGAVRHDVTFGASFFERKDKFGDAFYVIAGPSNIYNPIVVAEPAGTSGPVSQRRSDNERAVFMQDVLTLSSQWKLHVGVRDVKVKRDEFIADDTPNAKTDNNFLLPNAALVFSANDNVSLYGSYTQGLEHGGIAPFGTANQDVALSPSKSTQLELGVKADVTPDLMLAAALFQIRKGLEYIDADNFWVRKGTAQNRGLEMSAQGRLSSDLTLGFSAMALNTQQQGTGQPGIDGKRISDVPAFKSSVFLDYAVAQVPGLKVNGTWQYTGKKAFDLDNTVFVPGYHVLNAGAAYATKVGSMPTVLRANVD